MSNCLGPLNWLSRNCARQQLKMWIRGEKKSGKGAQEKYWQQRLRWENNALKWKWQNTLGIGWRRKNVRLAYAVMDGTMFRMSYVSCDSNELSNFMVTHGHIPTCSDSGYKWNSAVQFLFEPRGEAIRNVTANYVVNCKEKLKLPKFNISINGVKCVQKILIE